MKIRDTVDVQFTAEDLTYEVPTVAGKQKISMLEEMSWGGPPDSSEVLEVHASREAWWSARLTDEIAMVSRWIETVYDPYMAHLRKHVSYMLDGRGIQRKAVTKQDIHDAVFSLYGENRTKERRERLVKYAFRGYLLELFENPAEIDRLWKEDRSKYEAMFREFLGELFAYQQPPDPVWVEEAIRRRISLERSRELLSAAVKVYRDRGFMLRQAAENEKARRNVIQGTMLEDLAKKVSDILKEQSHVR